MKQMNHQKQFSKKLARWTSVFWFVYMIWLSTIFILQPTTAMYSVYMGIIVTVVMMVNVVAYTHNSIQEKLVYAMLDRTKLEMKFGSPSISGNCSAEEDDTEEGDNG